MQVVRTRAELRAALAAAPRPIGLVPTMGWLHAGHVSLVERARAESATVVVSIFVNPRQFGRVGGLRAVSRATRRATWRCARPRAWTSCSPRPWTRSTRRASTRGSSVGAIAGPLEGAARPGHFDGVATVVAILFALVGAERAYFGLKDYQQVQVIRRMALDLALPTEVVPCETVREPDGLATVLAQRPAHGRGPRGSTRAPAGARSRGRHGSGPASGLRAAVRGAMLAVLAAEPAATADYVSVADPDTLAELDVVAGRALLSLAVR